MKALRQTALFDTPAEESFDRLARLVAKVLRVPVALISLVDEERQFFKSCVGLPEPWASERETPLSHSFCQHVVASGAPLLIEDAREHPLVRENLAIGELAVVAYAGIPLGTPDGHVLGSLCAIDHRPRPWTEEEVGILSELAASVMTEVELRAEIRGRKAAEEVQGELEAVIESIPDAVYIGTREGITRSNGAGLRMLGFHSLDELKGSIAAVAERTQPRDATSGEAIRPDEGPFACALRGERVVREMIVRDAQTGGDRVLRVAAAPVRAADEVRGAVVVTTDVTERNEAAAEMERHRTFLRAVIDSSPSGVFVKDAEGRFTFANRLMAGFYSLAPEEMVGRTDADLGIPPERVERFRQMDQRVIETGELMSFPAEPLTSPRTGETRWFETRKVPLPAPGDGRQVLGIVTDVTGRERAAQELAASHARLEHLLTAGPAVIYSCRAEGDFGATFISDNVRAQLGYAPAQFTEEASFWIDNIHPEDRGVVLNGLGALFETDHHTHQYRFRRPDGTYLRMRDELRLVRDEQGAPQEIVGYWIDVTERKEGEEALRESERRLSTLISNLPGVAYRSRNDPKWTMEYIGGRTEELLGYAPEQLLGEGAVSLPERIHPEDRERVWEGVDAAVRAREPYRVEYRVRTAGGEEKWIWEQGQGIFGPGGEFQALEGFLTDVTERKEAEERERQIVRERVAREEAEGAQARIQSLLESITDAFFALDEHSLFTYVNAEAERILRRSREELLSSSIWDAFPDAVGSVFEERYRQALQEKRPVEFEAYYAPLETWFDVRAYPSAEGLTVYFRDVTEQRQAREALRRSEERYSVVARATHDAIWEFDPTTNELQWSPTFASVFGGEARNVDEWTARIHPEDRERVGSSFEHALEQRAEEWTAEYRFQRQDGSYAHVFDRAVCDYDGEGRPVRVIGALMDLSERRRAQEALRESEQRFRSLTEHSSDVVTVLDAEGLIRYESASVESVLGYNPEELLGRSAFELIHRDDLAEVLATFQRVLYDPGQDHRVEFRFRHKDGRWLHMEAIGSNHLEDPAVRGIVVNSRDITRRRRAEVEADLEQRRLRAVLDALPVGVFVADEDGRITRTNAAAERLWEAEDLPRSSSPEEYELYKGWWPGTGQRLEGHDWAMARALSGESVDEQEVEIETFDGARKVILAYARPIYGEAGDGTGAVTAVVDITERREAEEAVRRSERMLSEAEYIAHLGSWMWNTATDELSWSNGSYRIWGYEPGELTLTYEAFLGGIHPEDRAAVQAQLRAALEAGAAFETEYRVLRRDGSLRHVHARGQMMTNQAGQPVRMVGVVQDITERKQGEHALRAAKEEAERASRAKSEMLSRTSHELRTPMNAILGFAQLLEMEVSTEENRESVEQILRAGRHLLGLIDEVLDIARAESGHLVLSSAPVSVPELVQEAIALVRPLSDPLRVRLPPSVPDFCHRAVLADRQRLTQVLLNLLANAIKYNHEGGSVEIGCHETGKGRLRIEVRDTGPGIAPERLGRLFSPFERAGAEQTQVVGTGLGLALSRALVEAMGGDIGAESTPGEGSTFWIELPMAEARVEPVEEQHQEVDSPVSAPAPRAPVVLYVEDNPPNVRLVERILKRGRPGVELITAMQGRLGLDLARELRPDLILLDLDLPDVSGEEVLLALRKEASTQEIPVVMISGDAVPARVEQLREAGALDYLTKPFDVQELLQAVDAALAIERSE